MDYIICNGELYHHGIKGQKWGRRRYQNPDGTLTPAGVKRYSAMGRAVKGRPGPGMYIGKQRQLEGAKKELEILDKGGHLSYGLTKKRQEAYDKRDRAALEKKIAKLESENQARDAKKQAKSEYKQAKRSAYDDYAQSVKKADDRYEEDMASKNAELAKVNKRYDVKDIETKRYYDSEIEKYQKQAADAKRDMDAWDGLSSRSYKEAEARYNDSIKAAKNLETQRDGALYASSVARANANIKVNELFYDSSATAENTRNAAYAQAGREYAEKITSAKQAYKNAKKNR